MITLATVKPLDTTKPLPPTFKPNAYCHFHHQNGHDIEQCKHLKHLVQDLIDLGCLSLAGVNDQGNKSIAPPNQNLQIFTNPKPKHNVSFVKASEPSNTHVMNINTTNEQPNITPNVTQVNPMD